MDDKRVSVLEQKLERVQTKATKTQSKLDQITNIFLQLVTMKSEPLQPRTPNPPKTRAPRPALPSEFDRECSNGTAFLHSCDTYLRLCPDEFQDKQTKIVWAMSYMKTGRAFRWVSRIFRWEQLPENQTSTQFFNWKEFTEEFRKEFCPAQADSVAINTLESTSYFQKTRSLDNYLDQFQDLITD